MPDACIEDVMLAPASTFPRRSRAPWSGRRSGAGASPRTASDEAELGDFVEALERDAAHVHRRPRASRRVSSRRSVRTPRARRIGDDRPPPPHTVAAVAPTPPAAAGRPASIPSPSEGRPRRAPHGEPTPDRAAPGIIRVRSARDVVDVCDLARQLARTLGFNALDQTKVVTAASELARNILLYAGHGEVRVGVLDSPRRGIQIVASDSGPGIPDVDRVMSNGYRSRTGMGMGLKGAKRLMDELEIDSRVGVGTTVVAKKLVS